MHFSFGYSDKTKCFGCWQYTNRVLVIIYLIFFSNIKVFAANIVAVTEHLPPYQQVTDTGQLTGFSVEIAKALSQDVGDNIDIQVLPWERAFRMALKKPNVMIFSMYRIPSRDNKFRWLGKVDENIHYFYALRDQPQTHAKTIEHAKQLVTAVTDNAFEDKQLTKRGFEQLAKVSSPEKMVNLLFSKRVDLLFGSEIAIANLTTKSNRSVDDLIKLFRIANWGDGLWIAFSKNTEDAVFKRYLKAFNKLKENGKLEDIKARHFHFDFIQP